ncbi:MAG: hypothetical protein ACR2MX_06965 [Cyclobacteriaceae bacterium]
MKKIRLWLSCLFMVMLLMHIDAQAQEFVQNRKVITAQQSANASSLNGGSNNYQAARQGANQLAQAKPVNTYQKRTIQFKPVADSQKEARKARQKYKTGQFKRPKQNPRNKE